MRRYENTEEGAKVHDLQVKVTKAIDTLYAEEKINTKEDKAIIEQALSAIVNGTVEEIQQVAKVATEKSKTTVLGFFDYFFAGISDGSIRHGNNSDYSPGTSSFLDTLVANAIAITASWGKRISSHITKVA